MDCLKKKEYRKSLKGEKKEIYNEKAKLRMRAYRQRQKDKVQLKNPPPGKRLQRCGITGVKRRKNSEAECQMKPRPGKGKREEKGTSHLKENLTSTLL